MQILKELFGSLSTWLQSREREKDRESGRNEEKLDNANAAVNLVEKRNRINNADLPDSLLKRPEDRT